MESGKVSRKVADAIGEYVVRGGSTGVARRQRQNGKGTGELSAFFKYPIEIRKSSIRPT